MTCTSRRTRRCWPCARRRLMKRELTRLEKFLVVDDETRFDLLQDPATKEEAQRWMGSEALKEFLANRTDRRHLGAGPKNIVFAPGVMGSTLQSDGLGG